MIDKVAVPVAKLSSAETDHLAHFFYEANPKGFVDGTEELHTLLGHVSIELPDDVVRHCYDFCKRQTKSGQFDCDSFLETCEVAKCLELLTRFTPSDTLGDDVDVLVRQLEDKPPVVPDTVLQQLRSKAKRIPSGSGHSSMLQFVSPQQLSTEDLLHAYVDALDDAGNDDGVDDTSPLSNGGLGNQPRSPPQSPPTVVEKDAPPLLTHRASTTPLVTARRATRAAVLVKAVPPPRPPSLLETAKRVFLDSTGNKSGGVVFNFALRKSLAQFGLATDPSDAPMRPLSSLGVLDEHDDGYEVLADPSLYVSLTKRQLVELLRSKRQTIAATANSSSAPLDATQAVGADGDETDDLANIQDDLDGLQDLLSFLRAEQDRSTSPVDHDGDQSVQLMEDPMTGEISAVQVDGSGSNLRDMSDIAFSQLRRLATVETDLFVSPLRKAFLGEVRTFLAGGEQRDTSLSVTPRAGLLDPIDAEAHFHTQHAPNPTTDYSQRQSPDENETNVTPVPAGALHNNRRGTVVGGQRLAETASSSSAGAARRFFLHPLLQKARQIILRRLEKQSAHYSQNRFPINNPKKVALHSGLTPTQDSLVSPARSTVLANQTKESEESQRKIERRNLALLAHRERVQDSVTQLATQTQLLDKAFPACDMTYGDYFFVPQLRSRPKQTPLFFQNSFFEPSVGARNNLDKVQISRAKTKRNDNSLQLNQRVVVAPGITSLETHLTQPPSRYRSETNKERTPTPQFHNHKLLEHSFAEKPRTCALADIPSSVSRTRHARPRSETNASQNKRQPQTIKRPTPTLAPRTATAEQWWLKKDFLQNVVQKFLREKQAI